MKLYAVMELFGDQKPLGIVKANNNLEVNIRRVINKRFGIEAVIDKRLDEITASLTKTNSAVFDVTDGIFPFDHETRLYIQEVGYYE